MQVLPSGSNKTMHLADGRMTGIRDSLLTEECQLVPHQIEQDLYKILVDRAAGTAIVQGHQQFRLVF